MCCFSRPVSDVANTRIFARSPEPGRQIVVYSMKISASEDLAMVLPIPVPADSPDDAVRFISLKEYPEFFADLRKGFPEPAAPRPGSARLSRDLPLPEPLPVINVGSFEASFVPTVRDFSRLDTRFRLPEGTWDKLPQYQNYGFAVFKLKEGNQNVHPMAFNFPQRVPDRLFFPTVHIHDGKVYPKAKFDHTLYCQFDATNAPLNPQWMESIRPAGMYMRMDDCRDLINPSAHCYRMFLKGNLNNRDTWI